MNDAAVMFAVACWWLPVDEVDRWQYSHLPPEAECQARYNEAQAAVRTGSDMAKAHALFCKEFWWNAWWVTWGEGRMHGGETANAATRAKYANKMRGMIGDHNFRTSAWPTLGGGREMPKRW